MVNKYKTVKLLAVCLCFILVSILICFVHMQKEINTYRKLIYDSIYSQTEMGAGIIGRTFDRNREVVSTEAQEFARRENFSYVSIMDMLDSLRRKSSFEEVFYVNTQGAVFNAKNVIYRTNPDAVLDAIDLQKPAEIFLDKQYFGSDRHTFSVVSPITVNGIVYGLLVGTDKTDKLLQGLESKYISQVSECYIIDEEGQIVAFMQEEGASDNIGVSFYQKVIEKISAEEDGELFESNLRKGIAEGELGSLEVKLNKDHMHLFYAAIPGDENWELVYCVSENAIDKLVLPVTIEALISWSIIILIMILMCWVVNRFVGEDQKEISKLAYRDMLTEAPNENYFKIRARELLEEYHELPYVIVCFDIMNFRYLNEAYGHTKADTVLQAMVKAAQESYSYNETFARISADWFVSLTVNDGRHQERRRFLEERLSEAASSVYMNYPVRIKCGFYVVNDYRENISDMIDKANLARKAVDVDTKELEAEYVESLMEETRRREYIESQMDTALKEGEFVPFLQPKWNMKEKCVCGAEALVRWKKADGTIIPPGEFIPIFEKNGFIEKIDFYMLEEVCKYLRTQLDEGNVVYPISINQSRYLLHDLEYTQHVQKILLKYKIPKGLLEFELTETVFFQEHDRMIKVMQQLKDLNMELSIDDFGSGYSSLNLLRDIPFDVLKIDRGFLDKTATNESGKWILRKIVEMSEGLNVRVICEGVETQEQADMLLDIGCIYAQGFLYSRPIPIEKFICKYNSADR